MKFFIHLFLFYIIRLNSASTNFETKFISMRDGVKLAIDIYKLNKSDKYPVILEIIPYGKQSYLSFKRESNFWLDNGYVLIVADSRGTGESEGEFDFLTNEANDGYDLIDWIYKQEWSNGNIGMRGFSYSGSNQWFIATKQHPGLKCITPSATLGRPMEHPPFNGVFSPEWALSWVGKFAQIKNNSLSWLNENSTSWLKHKPLKTLDVYVTGRVLPLYRKFLEHTKLDSYWDQIVMKPENYSNIKIPTLSFTGWYDGTLYSTIMRFKDVVKYSSKKDDHFLIVGPYNHFSGVTGGYDLFTGEKVNTIGNVKINDNSYLPGQNMTKEFFNWCLKNETKPKWSKAQVYVKDEWQNGDIFLNDDLNNIYLYLSSEKGANSINGDGKLSLNELDKTSNDSYEYDPDHPVRSDINPEIIYPIDISFYLNRSDFLVYTSDVLLNTFSIFGEVKVELTISSNVKDTDFVIFLMDVHEDGSSIKLGSMGSNQIRTRYREGFDKEVLMEPNKMYKITINMYEISHEFLPGHRIRLAITSSFYPLLSANSNNGNPTGDDTDPSIKSIQTLHYGSHLKGINSRIHFKSKDSAIEFNSSYRLCIENIFLKLGLYLVITSLVLYFADYF
ncbi:unnamed protein product [Brachionus calyciflorus]|uniref:Xaa-Pro dipeptidyl-peptidase C-terminal domain-containing protein n=1 Tax=Brachionus calyciflorus TaxID=104777 RepID=A0A814FP21_9BILA|nr:unnamed protein product [Brachionus calyciflorus]